MPFSKEKRRFLIHNTMAKQRLSPESLPPSREVRLEDGLLHGEIERVAFDIYTGDAGTLANSMVKLELVVELERSKAVAGFAWLLRKKLMNDGYIVVADIDDTAFAWHMAEVMNESIQIPEPDVDQEAA